MHLQSKFISTVRLIFGEKKRENFYEFNNLNSSKPLIPKHFDDVLLLDWTKLLHYIFFLLECTHQTDYYRQMQLLPLQKWRKNLLNVPNFLKRD